MTKTLETAPQCGNCRFYLARNTGYGDCIRFPPIHAEHNTVGYASSKFPIVEPWRLCGEHQYKPNQKKQDAPIKVTVDRRNFSCLTEGCPLTHIRVTVAWDLREKIQMPLICPSCEQPLSGVV